MLSPMHTQDGYGDIIVGAPHSDPHGSMSGTAYVLFGGAAPSTLVLSALSAARGFALKGGASYDGAGGAVSAAGDVNGDGWPDVLVGAHRASEGGANAGCAYVVFGGPAVGADAPVELRALQPSTGLKVCGLLCLCVQVTVCVYC